MEHILFEHISGYELFELKSFEGLTAESYSDYLSLTQTVNHISSLPFSDMNEAYADIVMMNDSVMPESLQNFLDLNNVKILHADRSFKPILNKTGIEHKMSPNIMRGIRANIHKLLKKDIDRQLILSVSHMLSRSAIRYDMEREDNLVIAVGYECDQIEEEINKLSQQLDGMVEWILPQFKKLIEKDDINERLMDIFSNISDEKELISNEKELNNENTLISTFKKSPLLISFINDALKDIKSADLDNLKMINQKIFDKKRLLSELEAYLAEKMTILAPNLRCILGDKLCFKLIHKAGGLTNLSLLPSTTLQLLGAEKSLFRSLKMRTKTPKHGLLYNLEYLKKNRGRMCRYIASKCSIAARLDAFNKDRTDSYGKEFRKLIDKKMAALRNDLSVETTHDLIERVQSKILNKDKVKKEIKVKFEVSDKNTVSKNYNNKNISNGSKSNGSRGFDNKNTSGRSFDNRRKFNDKKTYANSSNDSQKKKLGKRIEKDRKKKASNQNKGAYY